MSIEIEMTKWDFVEHEIIMGMKDDNRNGKSLPTTFYLTELDNVVP